MGRTERHSEPLSERDDPTHQSSRVREPVTRDRILDTSRPANDVRMVSHVSRDGEGTSSGTGPTPVSLSQRPPDPPCSVRQSQGFLPSFGVVYRPCGRSIVLQGRMGREVGVGRTDRRTGSGRDVRRAYCVRTSTTDVGPTCTAVS